MPDNCSIYSHLPRNKFRLKKMEHKKHDHSIIGHPKVSQKSQILKKFTAVPEREFFFEFYSTMKIALKWPNLVWFSDFSDWKLVWLNSFCQKWITTIRNGGVDTKSLKIRPNLAVLDQFCIFLSCASTMLLPSSTWFLKKIKDCPKMANFGPIFKIFVSTPPFPVSYTHLTLPTIYSV